MSRPGNRWSVEVMASGTAASVAHLPPWSPPCHRPRLSLTAAARATSGLRSSRARRICPGDNGSGRKIARIRTPGSGSRSARSSCFGVSGTWRCQSAAARTSGSESVSTACISSVVRDLRKRTAAARSAGFEFHRPWSRMQYVSSPIAPRGSRAHSSGNTGRRDDRTRSSASHTGSV